MRVVNLRLGVVLSRAGGALAKMLLPFKMCVGGIVGSGSQYWSWLTVDSPTYPKNPLALLQIDSYAGRG